MIPENDPCRAYVFEAGLFEKENEMYFDLLPAIKFHCKKTLIQQLIPDCIYGSHNMDGAGKEGYEHSAFILNTISGRNIHHCWKDIFTGNFLF